MTENLVHPPRDEAKTKIRALAQRDTALDQSAAQGSEPLHRAGKGYTKHVDWTQERRA